LKNLEEKSARLEKQRAVTNAVMEARAREDEKRLKEREKAVAVGDIEKVRSIVDGAGRGRERSNLPAWMEKAGK